MSNLLSTQTTETSINKCFTFHEVEEIVAPLLGTTDFMTFMITAKFMTDGIPNKYYLAKNMFKIMQLSQSVATHLSHSIVIYITKTGMAIIVQKALRYYHNMHSLRN